MISHNLPNIFVSFPCSLQMRGCIQRLVYRILFSLLPADLVLICVSACITVIEVIMCSCSAFF